MAQQHTPAQADTPSTAQTLLQTAQALAAQATELGQHHQLLRDHRLSLQTQRTLSPALDDAIGAALVYLGVEAQAARVRAELCNSVAREDAQQARAALEGGAA
jgi:hypothetical protein